MPVLRAKRAAQKMHEWRVKRMEKRDGGRLRIGVIGCGAIAVRRHLPEFAARDDVEIAALYNRTREKAENMQKQYGGTVCGRVEELLSMDLDAVSICTANVTHAEYAVRALKAGMHVLCEKPMAMSPEECAAMTAEAEKAGRLLMIAHNQRFLTSHVIAAGLIQGGALGKLLSFEAEFSHAGPDEWTGTADPWFFRKNEAGMGVLADLGIHKTDLIHYLTGESVTEVSAHTATLDKTYPDGRPIDVEDNAWCFFRLQGGANGMMYVSWTNYGQGRNSVVLRGTEGAIRCGEDGEDSLLLETGEGVRRLPGDRERTENRPSGMIDEFIDCILTGKKCRSTGAEALKAMRVIFAAAESAASASPVRIPENG